MTTSYKETMVLLDELMERGWNIQIEGKGKGRSYEKTFEASAIRVHLPEGLYALPLYAMGDTLLCCLQNINKQINHLEENIL